MYLVFTLILSCILVIKFSSGLLHYFFEQNITCMLYRNILNFGHLNST
jgi:hypothetical protein